ncbi:uncharacterized protein LOC128217987 isoform X1 [Mya arenaria]|uniref:uncharacterized protein LOC128217987 isoform X1 n=1 Tax=Mya arenaria TaxID=6604 RepID=UPI0022E88167|nr:uncharacterized protein LOC128217987 isoform X1 [Mya arenaria]
MNIPHLPREKDYHVFVCHVNENVHEVRTIVTNLEKGGVKCCYDERDFTAGRSILENMLEKINESVHMLFVLSEDFSKSRFAKHELEEAIHQQIREDFSIIPLKIEPCDVPQILKNKTYIDCENDDITKVHHKIIEAVIDNGLKTQMKADDSGKMISISMSIQSGCLSMPKYEMRCTPDERLEISRKTKLTEEDINELESIVKESYFMKNIHIYDFFPHITCLLLVLYLMLSLAVMMFMVYTMLDTSRTDSASGGFAILLVSVISPVVATILSMGCCCWKKQTKNVNLMVKATKAVQRQLWSFNRNCQDKDAIVVFQSTHIVWSTATMKIIVINLRRCKDLFIRKCEQREEFQKRRREGETLNDYADRMINWLLCSKDIYLLDKPRQLQRGHSMINGAPCICLLLRDSLL